MAARRRLRRAVGDSGDEEEDAFGSPSESEGSEAAGDEGSEAAGDEASSPDSKNPEEQPLAVEGADQEDAVGDVAVQAEAFKDGVEGAAGDDAVEIWRRALRSRQSAGILKHEKKSAGLAPDTAQEPEPASFAIHSPAETPRGSPDSKNPEEPLEVEGADQEDAGEEKDSKSKEKDEDIPKPAKVPRNVRYFLHDDRTDEQAEAQPGKEGEEEAPKGKGKGKGRRKNQPMPDDDGPWVHDKYLELMEPEPRKAREQQSTQRRSKEEPGDDGSWAEKNQSSNDDGPWAHDKYLELVESEPRKPRGLQLTQRRPKDPSWGDGSWSKKNQSSNDDWEGEQWGNEDSWWSQSDSKSWSLRGGRQENQRGLDDSWGKGGGRQESQRGLDDSRGKGGRQENQKFMDDSWGKKKSTSGSRVEDWKCDAQSDSGQGWDNSGGDSSSGHRGHGKGGCGYRENKSSGGNADNWGSNDTKGNYDWDAKPSVRRYSEMIF